MHFGVALRNPKARVWLGTCAYNEIVIDGANSDGTITGYTKAQIAKLEISDTQF